MVCNRGDGSPLWLYVGMISKLIAITIIIWRFGDDTICRFNMHIYGATSNILPATSHYADNVLHCTVYLIKISCNGATETQPPEEKRRDAGCYSFSHDSSVIHLGNQWKNCMIFLVANTAWRSLVFWLYSSNCRMMVNHV